MLDAKEILHRIAEIVHGMGFPAHRFRQVAALLVADTTRRRANQAGDRMLLHEFRHVDSNEEIKTLAISNFLLFLYRHLQMK